MKRYASERMLASECVFVCLRCAKKNQSDESVKSLPLGWREEGKLEKGRECEDEMKGKIKSYVKEREREKRIWKERDI